MTSILVSKNAGRMARIRVQIPATLMAEIEAIKREAEGHGLTIDVATICADALARAVKQARAELARLAHAAAASNAVAAHKGGQADGGNVA